MPDPDHEARISALESRMDQVAADAAAARHLAAAGDRDLADLGIKVDANGRAITDLGAKVDAHGRAITDLGAQVGANGRAIVDLEVKADANRVAINALGVQTAGRFDRLEDEMRTGFAEMRGKFDQTAGGMQRIVDLLTDRDGQ